MTKKLYRRANAGLSRRAMVLFGAVLMLQGVGWCAVKPKEHKQVQANSGPEVRAVYVAYRTVNTGADNLAFPYTTSDVVVRAIVVARINGQDRAYTDLTGAPAGWDSGGTWHVYGTQGPNLPAESEWGWGPGPDYRWLSDISALYTTVHQWDTAKWGAPTFAWAQRKHRCYESRPADPSRERNYDYVDTAPPWSGWGTPSTGVNLPLGLRRYTVTVTCSSQHAVTSPNNESATRIAVHSADDFDIVVPPEGEPGHADAVMRQRYLRWIFCYLHEPYEYGGHWLGGRITDDWHGGASYDGYGVDCSGLVSCAAKWSGYNWGATAGGWRRSCTPSNANALGDVSEEVAAADVVPGDIMLLNYDGEHHVRTVYYRSGLTIHLIGAEGGTTSEVITLQNLHLDTEIETEHYVPRHLTAY